MTFWDSSAIVPLILEEPASHSLRQLADADDLLVWWGTPVECLSAIARSERDDDLAIDGAEQARHALSVLASSWNEVLASDRVREHAGRLLLRHRLCAANALQLAAAMTWARGRPRSHRFCTLDDRLADAARREGFLLVV